MGYGRKLTKKKHGSRNRALRNMDAVIMKEVPEKGWRPGDERNVQRGYYLNYLQPRGYAVRADEVNKTLLGSIRDGEAQAAQ